jgi:hypothetical protein
MMKNSSKMVTCSQGNGEPTTVTKVYTSQYIETPN